MKEPVWINREMVLTVHDLMLIEHGGAPGLRDESLLASALARPQQIFHYEKADLFTLAAAYVQGLLQNHPFIDGNKRTGFIIGYVFLARNHKLLKAAEAETTQAVWDLAAGKWSEKEYAQWLKDNCESTLS